MSDNRNTELASGIISFLIHLADGYAQAREIARQAGVTDADLDAADARFTKTYPDPALPPATVEVERPPVATNSKGFPLADYGRPLLAMPDTKQLEDGDVVYMQPSGRFYVTAHGVGQFGVPGDDWRQVWPR